MINKIRYNFVRFIFCRYALLLPLGVAAVTTAAVACEVSEEWVYTYNGGGDADDSGDAIAVDDEGNVYVAGKISINPLSDEDTEFAALSLDSAGRCRWRYSCNTLDDDTARDIALGPSGAVYIVGERYSPGAGDDIYIWKREPDGNLAWYNTYNGPGNDDDRAFAVAVDDTGNSYVGGVCRNLDTDYDLCIIKYDTNGAEEWVRTYGRVTGGTDGATDVVVDPDGYVYVAGYSENADGDCDVCVIKYTAAGKLEWVNTYRSTYTGDSVALALVLGPSGCIYVTGWLAYDGPAESMFVLKYDGYGNLVWVGIYEGTADCGDNVGYDIDVDGVGNVYVAGSCENSGSAEDFCVAKFDVDGDLEWVQAVDGEACYNESAFAIDVDVSGNVYAAGYLIITTTGSDICTIKYDKDGNEKWIAIHDGLYEEWDNNDKAYDLVLDDDGYVYVTGSVSNYSRESDLIVIKYRQGTVGITPGSFKAISAEGGIVLLWDLGASEDGLNCTFNIYRSGGLSALVNPEKTINVEPIVGSPPYRYVDTDVVEGISYNYWLEVTDVNGVVEKYGPVACTWDGQLRGSYTLYQSKPNPSRGGAVVRFDLPERTYVTLTVNDITGRNVAILVDNELPAGSYSIGVPELAPGVYFYYMRAGSFSRTRKMVVLE
jgi:uncharacterized delta-60 repeat protein